MKVCSVCGCYNADDARSCEICGVHFPVAEPPATPAVSASPLSPTVPTPASSPEPVPVPENVSEDKKPDRMAVAGFVLSVMGFFTCMTTPLQLAALILSIAAGKAKKLRVFRTLGIVLSAVALGISLILWLVIGINADAVLTYLTDVINEFYYY